jgi:ubiquinone biosynthesis protein UbiJ
MRTPPKPSKAATDPLMLEMAAEIKKLRHQNQRLKSRLARLRRHRNATNAEVQW